MRTKNDLEAEVQNLKEDLESLQSRKKSKEDQLSFVTNADLNYKKLLIQADPHGTEDVHSRCAASIDFHETQTRYIQDDLRRIEEEMHYKNELLEAKQQTLDILQRQRWRDLFNIVMLIVALASSIGTLWYAKVFSDSQKQNTTQTTKDTRAVSPAPQQTPKPPAKKSP